MKSFEKPQRERIEYNANSAYADLRTVCDVIDADSADSS